MRGARHHLGDARSACCCAYSRIKWGIVGGRRENACDVARRSDVPGRWDGMAGEHGAGVVWRETEANIMAHVAVICNGAIWSCNTHQY